MLKAQYLRWLEQRQYQASTIGAQVHRADRVEQYHGDLDQHYERDHMAELIRDLSYSKQDARLNRPNPSKIPIDGNLYNNLASYRDAVKRYQKFRGEHDRMGETCSPDEPSQAAHTDLRDEGIRHLIGLERALQAALRANIEQLEVGLAIIDEGAERSVESGFIDITARDASGAAVVIELKAGPAGQPAIAQILSYMGDLVTEEEGGRVRGILVASGFDAKAKAAARMVPALILRRYTHKFTFSDGNS